jgi:hypothetical protein
MIDDSRPIACSLPARESRNQIGEWTALAAHQVVATGSRVVTRSLSIPESHWLKILRGGSQRVEISSPLRRRGPGVRLMMTSENPDALPVSRCLWAARRTLARRQPDLEGRRFLAAGFLLGLIWKPPG